MSSSQLSPWLNNYFTHRCVSLERLLKSPSGRLFNLLFDRRLVGMTRQKKSIFIKSAIWNFQVKIHKDSERCFSSCHECRIKKKLSTVTLSTILVLAVCGTRVIDFVIDLAHRRVSVAQYRALKVWFSIPHRDSEVFLCYTLVTRRKTSFSIFFTEIKTYHLSHSIYRT